MKNPISLILLLGFTLVRVASASTYADDFPAALSNYVYGGWQGPFGDGTAGRLFPTADGTGIYMDATYNGYVWALRSSPEFSDADMTVRFVLPNRDNTEADWFGLWMLAHNPTTPPGGSCTTVCPFVVPESGLWLQFRVGFNQLVVTRFAGGVAVSSTIVPLPLVALNQPHDARAVYHDGSLIVYLDSVQLLNWPAPNVPAGQVGFEVYRTDMIVDATNVVAGPDLAAIANMTVAPGAAADQGISATDPDAYAITFTSSGPTFMTFTSNAQVGNTRTGNIHLAPPLGTTGTFTASVTATANAQSAVRSFTITVAANQAPAITAPATASGAEGVAMATITATATDADAADVLTITQAGMPASLTFTAQAPGVSPRTATITGTPALGSAGTYNIVWTVNDGAGGTATATTVLSICNGCLRPPTITAPNTANGTEGVAIATITATATDADAANTLTITQAGKPADLTFTAQAAGVSPRTATISGTPGFSDAGTYNITWTVTDGAGGTGTATTALTIAGGANQPPVITAPATASGPEGSPITPITATATDPDATNILTITQAGKPASLTFTAQAPGVSPRTATISGTPAAGSAGTYSIVWTVTDGAGGTASTTTVLTICLGCQRQPVITAPATASGAEGVAMATITASATDADAANTLTITQAGMPASLTFTAQAPGVSPRTATISGTPAFGSAGTYNVVWTVNDGAGATASATTVLTIGTGGPNRQPVITAPATASGVPGTPIATITATATDADAADVLTITQTGKPASLTFTAQAPGLSPRTATITGTPAVGSEGTYNIVWTVTDGVGGTASATTVLTIGTGGNRQPVITAPATASGPEGSPITPITATATDADATNTLTITQTGKPADLTFTAQAPGVSPRTATITGTPGFTDAGTFNIVWTVTDGVGGTASATTVLTITNVGRAPVITAPATASGAEGVAIATITATATDADAADVLTITQAGKPADLTFTAQAPGVSPRTATITGTPGFADAGTYSIVWTVNDGVGATASATTVLTVSRGVNRCPTANAGGPYSGIVNVPLAFDGTASSDPDGSPLSYAWDFDASDGVGIDATGPTSSHIYPVAGTYVVTLTVSDGICSNSATTTANIGGACAATVFNGYDVIRLGSGRPTWFVFVQPASGCYANADVVLSSFVLKYAGRQISADVTKTTLNTDKNGDGIQEIRVSFSKEALRTLFSGTGLVNGHNLVTVTIEANLVTGGLLQGTTQVDVFNNGDFTAASVSPNPLNPQATLTFTTERAGFARIELFDIGGRLVRTILDERTLLAGTHEVRIEGRGQRGETLASGIYFIRGVSADGTFTRTIAILK